MEPINNFKKLFEEEVRENPPPPELEENIFSNLHIMQLLGDTMELYIPQAAQLFISMLGGSVDSIESPDNDNFLVGGKVEHDPPDAPPGGGSAASDLE